VNYYANLLTYTTLALGFISIIFSLREHFTFACWAIIIAGIFDGLDGQVARRNPIPSEFGKQLDSLVDVIAFAVAPTVLGYAFLYHKFYLGAMLALFIYLSCSVARLAKYNLTPREQMRYYFYGLPTTVSGAVLASFILIYRRRQDIISAYFIPLVFIGAVLVLSFLMVSQARYFNLDGLKKLLGRKIGFTVLILAAIFILAVFLRRSGIFIFTLFLIYLLFSPFVVKKLDK
jgi:CDP-diacylglycerol--serine O-phosphatidyltransferase